MLRVERLVRGSLLKGLKTTSVSGIGELVCKKRALLGGTLLGSHAIVIISMIWLVLDNHKVIVDNSGFYRFFGHILDMYNLIDASKHLRQLIGASIPC